MRMNSALKRCGDNGGRNSWDESCRRYPAAGKKYCDLHDPDVVRCGVPLADGRACGSRPLIGGQRCALHKALGPKTARELVNQALFETNFAALRYLREALEANDHVLALKSAMHITRLCNAHKIEVEHTGGGPPAWLRWLPLDRRAQLAEWVNEARAAMAAGAPPVVVSAKALAAARDDDVIDGEATPVDGEATPVEESETRARTSDKEDDEE